MPVEVGDHVRLGLPNGSPDLLFLKLDDDHVAVAPEHIARVYPRIAAGVQPQFPILLDQRVPHGKRDLIRIEPMVVVQHKDKRRGRDYTLSRRLFRPEIDEKLAGAEQGGSGSDRDDGPGLLIDQQNFPGRYVLIDDRKPGPGQGLDIQARAGVEQQRRRRAGRGGRSLRNGSVLSPVLIQGGDIRSMILRMRGKRSRQGDGEKGARASGGEFHAYSLACIAFGPHGASDPQASA